MQRCWLRVEHEGKLSNPAKSGRIYLVREKIHSYQAWSSLRLSCNRAQPIARLLLLKLPLSKATSITGLYDPLKFLEQWKENQGEEVMCH